MRALALAEMCLIARQTVDAGGQQNAFGGNSGDNVTDTELTAQANLVIPRLWKLLTEKAPANYSFAYYNFPIISGVSVYPLPSDFKALLGVEVALDATNTNWVSLKPYNLHERNKYSYLQASTFSYVPWSNIEYQLQDLLGNPVQGGQNGGALSFIPNIGPLPANIRCSYQRAPPILCPTLPVAYATTTTTAQGALVYATLTAPNGVATKQVFLALNGGTTGGSAPSWNVPGTTGDNGIVWAYKGPLSIFATTFDGIAGWEALPILEMAIYIGLKQEMDVSGFAAKLAALEVSITEEIDKRQSGDPNCISAGWGANEVPAGYGGNWGSW